MKEIPLRSWSGDVIAAALIDDADFAVLARWRWCLSRLGGYAVRGETKGGRCRIYFMHRQLMSPPTGLFVDHKDGNKLNNQRANLRLCTKGQNMANQPPTRRNRYGLKGVSLDMRTGRWRAQIGHEKRNHYLGTFDTAEAARTAYLKAATDLHGEFAHA